MTIIIPAALEEESHIASTELTDEKLADYLRSKNTVGLDHVVTARRSDADVAEDVTVRAEEPHPGVATNE
jgi:hypothetical protein